MAPARRSGNKFPTRPGGAAGVSTGREGSSGGFFGVLVLGGVALSRRSQEKDRIDLKVNYLESKMD